MFLSSLVNTFPSISLSSGFYGPFPIFLVFIEEGKRGILTPNSSKSSISVRPQIWGLPCDLITLMTSSFIVESRVVSGDTLSESVLMGLKNCKSSCFFSGCLLLFYAISSIIFINYDFWLSSSYESLFNRYYSPLLSSPLLSIIGLLVTIGCFWSLTAGSGAL